MPLPRRTVMAPSKSTKGAGHGKKAGPSAATTAAPFPGGLPLLPPVPKPKKPKPLPLPEPPPGEFDRRGPLMLHLLGLHACMYVCMFVCMHAMHACIYVYVCLSVWVYSVE
jgi:hypothetical protein